VLGKLSSTASILMALEKRGASASPGQVADLLLRVKQKAIEQKSEVSDAQFDEMLETVLVERAPEPAGD
jgi:isopropylmalate/homocitrate/citramalate synthase